MVSLFLFKIRAQKPISKGVGRKSKGVNLMGIQGRESFFSIAFELITLERPMLYDLYINSSLRKSKDKFVKIFPTGDTLGSHDLKKFKQKYHQLYVLESQREAYLKSLLNCDHVDDIKKTEVIKDSAIVYLDRIFDQSKEFTTELLSETISGCRESVKSMVDVIKNYDISKLQSLIGDLSYHDFYTYDHSINVAMYSIAIFKELKKKHTHNEMVMVGLAGLLHDLGKIKIPTSIINNPGNLSDEDFAEIKKHPHYGIELLQSTDHKDFSDIDFKVIQRVVHEHHENYNGTGYPNGLKEDQIHLYARIVAIADFFDALTTKRSYHEVLSTADALELMSRSCGKKIDPAIFKVFVEGVEDFVITGKTRVELPDSFDPCQPQNVLPFQQAQAKKQACNIFDESKKEKSFGSVKVSGQTTNKKLMKEKGQKAS